MFSRISNLPFSKLVLFAGLATLAIIVFISLLVLATNRKRTERFRRGLISRLSYSAFIACIVVLCATAFGSILREGHMQHYALIAHTTAAGAFVFLLILVASSFLPRGSVTADNWRLERWSVWGLVVASLVTIATMLVSMYPLLETDGLIQAVVVHRYAGLLTAALAAIHLFSLIIGRLGYR